MMGDEVQYRCLFCYQELGWKEEWLPFPDFETALTYAQVEQEISACRILEFRIVEVPRSRLEQ